MSKNKLISTPRGFRKFRKLFGDAFTARVVSSSHVSYEKALRNFRRQKHPMKYAFSSLV